MSKSTLLPLTLVEKLKYVPHIFFQENCMESLLDRYYPELIANENKNHYHALWLSRWNKINIFEQELFNLEYDFQLKNIQIILLKGMSLAHTLYPDLGSRFMSDIDILVYKSNIPDIQKILHDKGYQIVSESKWKANDYKITFEKQVANTAIIIEVHTRLFFHVEFPIGDTIFFKNSSLKTLNLEMNLVHLIGHLAFSHTFLKFFWLIDIYLFLIHYEKQIHWVHFLELIRKYQLKNSCTMIFYILHRHFQYHTPDIIPSPSIVQRMIYPKLLTFSFLINNQQFKIRYFFIKHLTKDNLYTAIKYDFLWLIDYLKQKTKKRLDVEKK